MSSVSLVPATAAMVAAFYPELRCTVRAIAAVRDEEVLGLAGYYVDGARAVIFSNVKPGALPAKTAMRAAQRVLAMAIKTRLPLHAVPDAGVAGSRRFLQFLGFRPTSAGVYVWQP